jgi:hypothetical protein
MTRIMAATHLSTRIHAAAHPGKMGDALYCLPLLRYLYGQNGWLFDFYTSEYCAPLQSLFEYQPYINRFIVNGDYRVENFGCGAQPWQVGITGDYPQVYQLGFRRIPDSALHQFIAKEIGVTIPLGISYECPESPFPRDDDYICIAPRGNSSYNEILDKLAQEKQAIVIGGKGDYRGYGIDQTGANMLETASILSGAKGFVGLMSSQLALANGFDIPRIALGGHHSDMRHAIRTHLNHYPGDNVTVESILKLL